MLGNKRKSVIDEAIGMIVCECATAPVCPHNTRCPRTSSVDFGLLPPAKRNCSRGTTHSFPPMSTPQLAQAQCQWNSGHDSSWTVHNNNNNNLDAVESMDTTSSTTFEPAAQMERPPGQVITSSHIVPTVVSRCSRCLAGEGGHIHHILS